MFGCSNEKGYILKSFRKYLLSISVLLRAYCAHLPGLFHHQIWLEKEHVFFFKVASNSSHQRRTLTTDEVINAAFGDDDSGDEFLESSSDKHRCYKWKRTAKEERTKDKGRDF